jgi:acetyltransferase-like isoleucine patch superfamily enzyme
MKQFSLGRAIKMRLRGIFKPIIRLLRYYELQTPYIEGDGGKLIIGKKVSLTNALINVESGSVWIGDNTIFGYDVMLLTGRHLFEDGERVSVRHGGGAGVEVPRSGFDIVIGKNCWIASGAIISGNVTIGDSCVIAAGSVVVASVPAYSFVGGVPAKIIGDSRRHLVK